MEGKVAIVTGVDVAIIDINGDKARNAADDTKGMEPREFFLRAVSGIPLKREQTAKDFGRAVVFLVPEDARNITGQSLNADGGADVS